MITLSAPGSGTVIHSTTYPRTAESAMDHATLIRGMKSTDANLSARSRGLTRHRFDREAAAALPGVIAECGPAVTEEEWVAARISEAPPMSAPCRAELSLLLRPPSDRKVVRFKRAPPSGWRQDGYEQSPDDAPLAV
jgi:hypothetical protein